MLAQQVGDPVCGGGAGEFVLAHGARERTGGRYGGSARGVSHLRGGDGRGWHTGHRCRRMASGMYTQQVVWDSLSPGQVELNH